MYFLSRLMLIFASMLVAYATAVLCIIIGWPGWIVLGLLLAAVFKRRQRILTALGSACWAGESELRAAGMLGARHGFILGRFGTRENIIERMKALFRKSLRARDACEKLIARTGSDLVRLRDTPTLVTFAPTGLGKGASLAIPFLLTCPESCVVIDFKGELAFRTAVARRRMNNEIVILDPFKVVTK